MLSLLLLLALPVSAVALAYARFEYRRRGKLTVVGLSLVCLMLLVPNLMLEYATVYEWPRTLPDYVGVLLGLAGVALMVVGITAFRSVTKVLCLDAGELTETGPYVRSRNPQYVGYFLLLAGIALNDWSLWCLAALLVVAIDLHLLVLVEEEHLLQVFGERYAGFRRQVPRYVRLGSLRF